MGQALTGAPTRRRSPSPLARAIAIGMKIGRLHGRLDEIERQHMAQVRWGGETFTAKPIEQNADGSWTMEALQHTGRTAPGTRITVKPSEIVAGTMPAAGQPDTTAAPADDGKASLEAAMAEERKTLVSPADLIAQFQASKKDAPQGDAGAVPPGPTPAPAAAPQNQGKGMPHLADKLKQLASSTQDFAATLESTIDAKLAAHQSKKTELAGRVDAVFAKTDAISADAEAGIKALEDTLNQLTNG